MWDVNDEQPDDPLLWVATSIVTGLLASGHFTKRAAEGEQPLIWTDLVPHALGIAKQLIDAVEREGDESNGE
jgi:hypothetical protein